MDTSLNRQNIRQDFYQNLAMPQWNCVCVC